MASSEASSPFHWHFTVLDDRSLQIHGHTLFFLAVLFSIILLIVLLVLYTRWACRFHRLAASSSAARPPSSGLDASAIDSLPITLHESSAAAAATAANLECCICLSVFEDCEKVKVLPHCRHCYHSECVDRWLRRQSSCPLCRLSLRLENLALPQP